jgi:membrane fusion protein, multidrug efflux system
MKFILPLAAVLALAAGCNRHTPPPMAGITPLPAARVRTTVVGVEPIAAVVEVTGTVRPVQQAQLAAKVMGTIDELPVTLGQQVARGALLVKISAGEINARLVQAQSQLSSVRRDLERERALLTKGASTADMLRGLEERFSAAEAMVREAEVTLGYTTLRAPFDGVVARKFVHAGDLASPGMPLLELEGLGAFQIETAIPDSLAATLAVGSPVSVELPTSGARFTGPLAEISSTAQSGTRSVLAKISVPAGTAVRSGEFVRVEFAGRATPTLLAPASAVTALGQMERIFVAGEGNRATLRLVKTGAAHGDRLEILAGLDPGERIVLSPAATLQEGQPLEFLP